MADNTKYCFDSILFSQRTRKEFLFHVVNSWEGSSVAAAKAELEAIEEINNASR